jgi:rod shape-determining protein MreC
MLKRLYDIVLLFKEYFLLGLFLVISVTLLALNDTRQIHTIRSFTVVSVGILQDALSFIPDYFDLRRENRVLRELNLVLSEEVSRLREGKLENLRLRKLLSMKERSTYEYVSANIVGKNLQLLRNTVTIDVGDKDGVKPNMPIVNDEGLVGKIAATGSGYAVGQILLNKELRVSAKVQRSRVDGIIRWEGGRTLALQDVAKTLDVTVGDAVITSDYSSLFPAGIKIGVVSATREIPGSLFQAIDVMPSVDFSRLEEVFVVLHSSDSVRTALEQRFHE